MTLKEIFDKAENGVLNYEQFTAAAGTAKFVDLTEGGYVDKQKYTDELAARDARITSLDDTIKLRDTDLASLKQQLESAGTDATKLNDLNTKFNDLTAKYDKDTKALQKQLKDQAYKYAVNEFASKQEFTSQAAKRDFIQSMLAKDLKMEDGVLIGATDFVASYTQNNADAFKPSAPAEPPKPQPHFVEPSAPTGASGESTPFQFNFAGVRPHK